MKMTLVQFFRFLFAHPLAFLIPDMGAAFEDLFLTDVFVIGFFAVGLISGAFRLVSRLSEE